MTSPPRTDPPAGAGLPRVGIFDLFKVGIGPSSSHGGRLSLLGQREIAFDPGRDIVAHRRKRLPGHVNGMRFSARGGDGETLTGRDYYSVGGGFVVDGDAPVPEPAVPEPSVMEQCVARGCTQTGTLPGGLEVRRRAPALHASLSGDDAAAGDPMRGIEWVSLWAIAVNEENAAGGRVVTAPTNGAAGIVPAVLHYYDRMVPGADAGGLVQIPCIERNAIAAVKAIAAARLALKGDGEHRVSLDKVIRTMRETGADMHDKYKETARGGLAVNLVEC